jgi:uncharacterized protein (DUF362 family)
MTGLLVAGFNAVAVDTVCATLMGFDYRRIPMLARAWENGDLPLVGFHAEDLRCRSNVPEWTGTLAALVQAPHLSFEPHFGWKGHIERGAKL